MRTLVDIPDEDLTLLNKLSKARRLSRAQLVRAAISTYLHSQSDDLTTPAFGLWSTHKKKEDGLAYQDRMRREW
jgi:metal-responsive CopG/Arc/MetJ family transcriptional regulator